VDNEDDAIDLRQLIDTLWDGKWRIAAWAVMTTMVAAAYAFLTPAVYRSEVLLQPRQESKSASGIGAMMSQLGGLPEVAGLSFGAGGDKAVALATLKSRAVVERFIEEAGVLPLLYPSAWDTEAKAWKDTGKIPNVWKAYNKFVKDVMHIVEDKKSGLVTVSMEWGDPRIAQQWATDVVARTNEHLRTKAIQEGESNLAYLEAQVKAVSLVELRQALFTLMESEQKKLMLAKGSAEYALRTIDPAVAPMERVRPQRLRILTIGAFLGAMLGVAVLLGARAWREYGGSRPAPANG
jgi:uncharacterized protein involved in exopolysaccharide biosynthesis